VGGAAVGAGVDVVEVSIGDVVTSDVDEDVDDDDDEEEEEDFDDEDDVDRVLVDEMVPSVVGSVRVVGDFVREMLIVGRVRTAVAPLALFMTVVPKVLAIPQPNCEYPPSKTFM
jgi:hypothetical protein